MPALLNDSKWRIKTISQLAGFLGKAFIGCDHSKIILLLLGKVPGLQNLRGQFIYGYIKETLNLPGMHIHRQHPLRASNGNTIGAQADGDRYTRLIFLVGTTKGRISNASVNAGSKG